MDKFTTIDYGFDEVKDLAEVDQFGAIDLRSAFVNSSVPENVEISAESFNGVDDAQSLVGRPSDVFDAIRKADYVASRAASAAKATEGATATSGDSE